MQSDTEKLIKEKDACIADMKKEIEDFKIREH